MTTSFACFAAMGVAVAFGYSVVATVAPQIFPAALRGEMGQPDVYYETAAAITVLVLLGQMLELRARAQTGSAIRALLDLAPKMATRIRRDAVLRRIAAGRTRLRGVWLGQGQEGLRWRRRTFTAA